MKKLWPWSQGAPVTDEHNELEEKMGPDPEEEFEVYDFQQRVAGGETVAGDESMPKRKADDQGRDG